MVTQLVFDLEAGQRAGETGMALAALKRGDLLALARRLAVVAAQERPDHTATADDVQERLLQMGVEPRALGNAAGSLFRKDPRWQFTGRWCHSRRVANHHRAIRVWMLIG